MAFSSKIVRPSQWMFIFGVTLLASACGGGSNETSTVAATPPPAASAPASAVCGLSDHPRVGQVAQLKTIAHNVSGKATVIDNCTIELTGFSYDGQGLPDVFVYGAKDRNYNAGFAIGPNLFGKPQFNATFRITLKEGELERLDGISIWCVRAAVSFGDGLFAKVTN